MTISAGSSTSIDTSTFPPGAACARIDDTTMLVAYHNASSELGARVVDITVSTKSLTPNAESLIAHAFNMEDIRLVRMSSTKFMFIGGQVTTPTARVLNVSGTTVTGGPTKTLTDTTLGVSPRLLPLTATSVFYAYEYSSGPSVDWVGRILTIDGSDNITEGARSSPFASHATTSQAGADPVMYTATTGAFFWQDRNDTFYLKGQLFTISGSTISLSGSAQTIYNSLGGWADGVAAAPFSSTLAYVGHNVDNSSTEELANHMVTLTGSTLSPGPTLIMGNAEFRTPEAAVFTNATTILLSGGNSVQTRITQIIKAGTTLSHTTSDFVNITNSSALFDSLKKIQDNYALAITLNSVEGTVIGSDAAATASHIWLSTDGAATFTDIGDAAWGTNLVGAVAVVPGTAYQTIYAAVGTSLYKTTNGGTSWSLETAVGYEVDSIDLEKDNTTVILANRASGGNRASLWDGAVLTHINTGKSTTGGATAISDVV